jgi:hypothetical protein
MSGVCAVRPHRGRRGPLDEELRRLRGGHCDVLCRKDHRGLDKLMNLRTHNYIRPDELDYKMIKKFLYFVLFFFSFSLLFFPSFSFAKCCWLGWPLPLATHGSPWWQAEHCMPRLPRVSGSPGPCKGSRSSCRRATRPRTRRAAAGGHPSCAPRALMIYTSFGRWRKDERRARGGGCV